MKGDMLREITQRKRRNCQYGLGIELEGENMDVARYRTR